MLVDEGPSPAGGCSRRRRRAAPLLAQRAQEAGVEILTRAPALGYFDGLVPVWQGDTLHQIRARRHVFATGTIEQPLVFAGNDLPGVMLSGGARRLADALRGASRYPRRRRHDLGPRARGGGALHRRRRSDRRGRRSPCRAGTAAAAALRSRGVEVLADHAIVAATGRKAVERRGARADRRRGARARSSTATCSSSPAASRRRPRCCCRPAGAPTMTSTADISRSPSPEGMLRAGELTGTEGVEAIGAAGAVAGYEAAHALGSATRPREGRRQAAAARQAASRRGRGAAAGQRRRARQVLRLLLRGRDRQGHPRERRRGLRLDRAVQALHDRDDGAVPGPHVPAARRSA